MKKERICVYHDNKSLPRRHDLKMLHDLFFLLNDTIKNIERPTTNEPFVIAASSVMLVFHAQFALKSKSVSE